jgi:DNA-binding transcriptional LysR family regulator
MLSADTEIADNRQIFIAGIATMDRLGAMRLFTRVAELGSFAAAAQQLGVARSVVTRQIAALEAHLGLVDAAETDIALERVAPRGPIRVSLPLSFGFARLAPLLLDFAGH